MISKVALLSMQPIVKPLNKTYGSIGSQRLEVVTNLKSPLTLFCDNIGVVKEPRYHQKYAHIV